MANGVESGARGNGIFCLSRLGAAPSLLSGFVLLLLVLALLMSASVVSHVSQPSADMKFWTVPESLSVFDGETESNGRFAGLVETVVVELGGFVHCHSEIFSVEVGYWNQHCCSWHGIRDCFSWLLVGVWLLRAFVSVFLLVAKCLSSGDFWGYRNSGRLFVDVPMPLFVSYGFATLAVVRSLKVSRKSTQSVSWPFPVLVLLGWRMAS